MTRRLRVAGVDEAGRGPLAGPVAVAAVILHPARPIDGLDDSKVLTEARREALAPLIRERALAWRVELIDVADIDRLNSDHATMLGMTRAVCGLAPVDEHAFGDRLPPGLPCRARAIVGGDAIEPAIMAASILAKTARDAVMRALEVVHPGYGFALHKGYSTPEHFAALRRLGPCAQHRRSFAPVRACLAPGLFDTAEAQA